MDGLRRNLGDAQHVLGAGGGCRTVRKPIDHRHPAAAIETPRHPNAGHGLRHSSLRIPLAQDSTGLVPRLFGAVLSADRRIDKEVKLLFSLVPKAQQKSLTSAQKVFLTYRKSTCTSFSDVYRGGTFAPVEYALCEVRLDEVQSTTLHVYFRLANEGASRSLTWP